jgi:alpha-beta hydrolase superfamily lysophospholipase
MTEIRLDVGPQRIGGRLLLPADAATRHAAVLYVHGWGATQRHDIGKAKRLRPLGYVGLTFNLRGHARTRRQRDTVTRSDNLRDLLTAYDFLVEQPAVDPERIVVAGSSYGAYLAVLLTADRKVRALALQAPAIYKDRDFDRPKTALNLDGDLPAYRRMPLTPDDNLALRNAARFAGDVLLVESEHDTIIPHQTVDNYRAAFTAAASVGHRLLAHADHGLSRPEWRRAYSAALTEWLPRVVPAR